MPQMTIRSMCIACWIRKATNTLSICNTHGCSTETIVARTRVNVSFYIHCLFGPYKQRAREIFVLATGKGFSPSTSIFPCQHLSTTAPHSSSSTRCCYRLEKRTKTRSLTKNIAISEVGKNWIEMYFCLAFEG